MSKEETDATFLANTVKLASKLAGALKTKDGKLLEMVKFKKSGEGFYYSLSDKRHVLVNRGEEWYYVPFIAKDDMGRICLYSPYLFSMAVFIMVPEEEVETIGFN
jgi:hypothetical protein